MVTEGGGQLAWAWPKALQLASQAPSTGHFGVPRSAAHFGEVYGASQPPLQGPSHFAAPPLR